VPTAVATSGTSFGDGHVKVLRRLLMDADQFRGEVIFTFDGDAAGQRAVLRAFDLEEKFVTQTFVTVQPDGLDPCDLWRKQGPEAVRDLIARRVPIYEFAIRSELAKYDLNTNEGRLAALDASARIVGRIKDRGLINRYAVSLDKWLGMLDEEFVRTRVLEQAARQGGSRRPDGRPDRVSAKPRGSGERTQGQPPGKGAARDSRPGEARGDTGPGEQARYDPGDPVVRAEREALKLAVQRPALCGPAFDVLGPAAFTAHPHATVRELIEVCGGARGAASVQEWVTRLMNAAPDDQIRGFVTQLAVEQLQVPKMDGEADARYADAVLAQVEARAVGRRVVEVKSRLQRLNPVEAQPEYNRTFGDLIALEQRYKALVEKAAGAF
jgi:DNA primase